MSQVVVKQVEATPVVAVEQRGSVWEVARAFHLLFQEAERHSIQPAGPPIVVYFPEGHPPNLEDMKYWVCVPTAGPVEVSPPLMYEELPSAQMATFVHRGPYETMGDSYKALEVWVKENGYQVVGPPREIYLVAPSPEKPVQPAEYVTEIQFPIARGGQQ